MTEGGTQVRKLGIAVIGRGVWGCHSLEQEMLKCPGTRIIGVHSAERWGESSVAGTAESAGQRYAADLHTENFSDWRSLILDPRVDVVSLMAAPNARFAPAELAMTNGKYVVVDKPLAATTHEADQLAAIEHSAKGKGFVLCGLQYEHKVSRLGEEIRNGNLGALVSGRVTLHFTGGIFPGFVPNARYVQGTLGGELTVIGSHALQTLLWLFSGERIISVYARLRNHFYPQYQRVGMEDWAEVIVRFASGAVGSVQVSRLPHKPDIQPEVIEVTGTAGFARVTADRLTLWPGQTEIAETLTPAERLQATFAQVLAAVRFGKPTPMSFQDGARLNHLLAAAYRSATNGYASVLDNL